MQAVQAEGPLPVRREAVLTLSGNSVMTVVSDIPQSLQVLISRDPVIVLEQERLDHGCQLHIEIEEVYGECNYKQT